MKAPVSLYCLPLLLVLAACSTTRPAPVEKTSAPAAVQTAAAGLITEEEATRGAVKIGTFADTKQALPAILTAMKRLDAKIQADITEPLTSKSVYNLTLGLADSGMACTIKTAFADHRLIVEPLYVDNHYLIRAHSNPAFEAQLPPYQQRALQKARQIVAEVKARYTGERDIALALHDYIITHATYDADMVTADVEQCTSDLLLKGRGICEGYTRAYGVLLSIAGIENAYVPGRADEVDHCWNLVRLDGSWVHVDCTYDDPLPDEEGRVLRTYFGLSDGMLKAYRSWQRALLPR